jgi:hypothetical protein
MRLQAVDVTVWRLRLQICETSRPLRTADENWTLVRAGQSLQPVFMIHLPDDSARTSPLLLQQQQRTVYIADATNAKSTDRCHVCARGPK